jgi:hypothetical protein
MVLQSTLAGELIEDPLGVSMATQPEANIHFVPSTGAMWISSEPNELLQFSAASDDRSLTLSLPQIIRLLLRFSRLLGSGSWSWGLMMHCST